jgi:hypothetical protein
MIISIITTKHLLIGHKYLMHQFHTVLQLRVLTLQILDQERFVLEVERVVVQVGGVYRNFGSLGGFEKLLEGYFFAGGILGIHFVVIGLR